MSNPPNNLDGGLDSTYKPDQIQKSLPVKTGRLEFVCTHLRTAPVEL